MVFGFICSVLPISNFTTLKTWVSNFSSLGSPALSPASPDRSHSANTLSRIILISALMQIELPAIDFHKYINSRIYVGEVDWRLSDTFANELEHRRMYRFLRFTKDVRPFALGKLSRIVCQQFIYEASSNKMAIKFK